MKSVIISGKRKTSVARVRMVEGTGKVIYNNNPISELRWLHRLALNEPIAIAKQVLGDFKFDIYIKATSGGKESQIQAARLGIAKAIVKLSNSTELKKTYLTYDRHMLIADTRRKEAYKPGDSKARSKRQKSYR